MRKSEHFFWRLYMVSHLTLHMLAYDDKLN